METNFTEKEFEHKLNYSITKENGVVITWVIM